MGSGIGGEAVLGGAVLGGGTTVLSNDLICNFGAQVLERSSCVEM